jgi:hypothetical protein
MPTKAGLIEVHQKQILHCDEALANHDLGERQKQTVLANRRLSQDWVDFLSRPDTPELGW